MSEQKSAKKKYSPPYGAVSWYEKFFDLMKRLTIERVDKSFLVTNEIAPKEEYKVINGLKFLDLIDEDGKATGLVSLRLLGDDFTDNLKKIVENSYSGLLSKIKLEEALKEDVTNVFIRDYKMGRSSAKRATKIFIFLAKQAKLGLSESLSSVDISVRRTKRKTRTKQTTQEKKEKTRYQPSTAEMVKIEYGKKFTLFLQKGNRDAREKVAKLAKQFIDAYVEDVEEETE